MEKEDLEVGQKVVVNNRRNTIVFTVARFLNDKVVDLKYPAQGRWICGGLMGINMLKVPTKRQLADYQPYYDNLP